MLDDSKPVTPTQREQIAAGQFMALSAAVHALIATHPDRAAVEASFSQFDAATQDIFLMSAALTADDGMRQAYSEIRASLLVEMTR